MLVYSLETINISAQSWFFCSLPPWCWTNPLSHVLTQNLCFLQSSASSSTAEWNSIVGKIIYTEEIIFLSLFSTWLAFRGLGWFWLQWDISPSHPQLAPCQCRVSLSFHAVPLGLSYQSAWPDYQAAVGWIKWSLHCCCLINTSMSLLHFLSESSSKCSLAAALPVGHCSQDWVDDFTCRLA